MNKELIRKRFEKNLTTYDANALVQLKMAEHLISFTEKKHYNNILEIGCGTGLLTRLVLENINFNNYIANDIVCGCQNYIEKLSDKIDFVQADIEETIKTSPKTFDLIISNASFQWVENLEEFINNLLKKLNPNGELIFTTFGRENFREIFYVLNKTLPYHSVEDYKKMFNNLNLKIEEEVRIMAFKTPKDVLKHIKYTGVNAIEEYVWTKKDLLEFENGYNNFCSNRPTLTYNPIYIKIIKT